MPGHRRLRILVLDLNRGARLHCCREAEFVGVNDAIAVEDVRRVSCLAGYPGCGSIRHSHTGVKDAVSIVDVLERLH